MKVAVLMGGSSAARLESLANGKRVCEALTARGHAVVPLDTTANLARILRQERPDIVFNTLLAFDGESGAVQELLEFMEVPCVGSSSAVCRDAWDRGMVGSVLNGYRGALGGTMTAAWPQGVRLSYTAFEQMGASAVLDLVEERIPGGFPVSVKTAHRGLGFAARKVHDQQQLMQVVTGALAVDRAVVIQQWVEGVPVQVFLLGEGMEAFVLPPVELEYATDATADGQSALTVHAPVRLASLSSDEGDAQAIRSEIERAALEAYLAFGLRDMGQVDLVWDGAQPRVLQVSTGIDLRTDAPFDQACRAASLSFEAVADALVGGLTL